MSKPCAAHTDPSKLPDMVYVMGEDGISTWKHISTVLAEDSSHVEDLRSTLEEALYIIRYWHGEHLGGMDDDKKEELWERYRRTSHAMKRITAMLGKPSP